MGDLTGLGDFTGIPSEGLTFLRGLDQDNTKAYFDSHRQIYDEFLMEPIRAMVVDLGAELQDRVSPEVNAVPKVNKSIAPINRDTRFSADKTPYNTHIRLHFWDGEGKPRNRPSFFLGLGVDDVGLGAGKYGLDKPELEAFRTAVADDRRGSGLVAAVREATAAGAELNEPDLKRVPQGYDADHPRADLLRYKGFYVFCSEPTPAEVASADFVG